ncbi:hypothetical protein [Gemmatimonas sp.]|uniref:hypothetical protein n=1 Tax=Gemmatimonas sp. TaxID=1962908 RepID=UPI0039838976
MYDVFPAGLAAGAGTGGADGAAAGAGVDTGAEGAAAVGAGSAFTPTLGGVTLGVATGAKEAAAGAGTDTLAVTGGGAASAIATGLAVACVTVDEFTTTGITADAADVAAVIDAVVAAVFVANAADSVAPLVAGATTAAGNSVTDDAVMADTVAAPDSPAAVRAPTAPARDALRGRRSALSAAMRSAAGFVLAKPAV